MTKPQDHPEFETYRTGFIDGYIAHGGNYSDVSADDADDVVEGFQQHFGDESDR